MTDILFETPAARIVARFGAKHLADWTGRHVTRVYAWSWPPDRGGTGGVIPIRARKRIIEGARRDLGIELQFSEFEPIGAEQYHLGAA